MDFVILQSGGKQYKAAVGSILEVDKLDVEPGKTHIFDKVLLYTSDGVSKIGQPEVAGVVVTGKIVEQFKGEKIRVGHYKAKARYRKVTGHRQLLTKVQITEISVNQKSKEDKQSKPAPEAKTKNESK